MEANVQMHAVILRPGGSKRAVGAQIGGIGGEVVSDIGHRHALLANLTLDQAMALSNDSQVKLVAPVGMNHEVRRLRVRLDSAGRPLWRYETRGNDIVRIDLSVDDDPPTE